MPQVAESTTVPAQDAAPKVDVTAAEAAGTGPGVGQPPDPAAVTTPAEFAAALGALREHAGLGIRELADRIGSSSSTLSDYLAGRRLPPGSALPLLDQLLAACKVPPGAPREAWLQALDRARMPAAGSLEPTSPYPGLASYRIADAGFFFGREVLVARLTALVTSTSSTGP